jgi:hypothetical protein
MKEIKIELNKGIHWTFENVLLDELVYNKLNDELRDFSINELSIEMTEELNNELRNNMKEIKKELDWTLYNPIAIHINQLSAEIKLMTNIVNQIK